MKMNKSTETPKRTEALLNAYKDKQEVELKLVTDDLIVGKIMWQDSQCLCLLDHYDQPTLIWRQSLVYLKPKS